MNDFKIIWGGIQLETNPDISITINYNLMDLFDPGSRDTNKTYTIVLPGTKHNLDTLSHPNIPSVSGKNFLQATPAQILIGSQPILVGNGKVEKIINNIDESEIEISICGNIETMFDIMSDGQLNQLNFSEYDHIRSRSNIINSQTNIIHINGTQTEVPKGIGYTYPYIIYGDSTEVFAKHNISEFYPAFYIKTIWDKLINYCGKTYTGRFLNTNYFSKLLYPYQGGKIQKSEETITEQSTLIGVDAAQTYQPVSPYMTRLSSSWWKNYNDSDGRLGWPLPLNRESGTVDDSSGEITFKDDLGTWNSTNTGLNIGKYTCEVTGYYDIEFDGKLIAEYYDIDGLNIGGWTGNGTFNYMYHLFKNGSIIDSSSSIPMTFQPSDTGTHSSPWYDINQPLAFDLSATNILLEEGDVISVGFGVQYPQTGTSWVGDDNRVLLRMNLKQSLDGSFTKFSVVPADNSDMGNTEISMNTMLPEMKMKDFFMGIVNMFNLVIVDDPNDKNNLIIETYDDYFASKKKIVNVGTGIDDWEIDETNVEIIPMSDLDFKTYKFTYQEDDCMYNKDYQERFKRVYGDKILNIDNDFSTNEDKIELQFASTPVATKFINDRVAPFFAEVDGDSFKSKKVKPRILFDGGLEDTAGFRLQDYEGGPYTDLTDYLFCSMWDDRFNPSYDLSFDYPKTLYFDSTQMPTNNLYNKFHRSRLGNIIDKDARILRGYFKLRPSDIAQFDFRDIIRYDNIYWRVNKIEGYDPVGIDSLTKVELIKISNIASYDGEAVEIPTSNRHCPLDVVGKFSDKGNYYVSLSGQIITEDCCRSLGGYLSDGVCMVRDNSKPTFPSETGVSSPIDTLGSLPVSDPTGPTVYRSNGNTSNNANTKFQGTNNYGPKAATGQVSIIGDNNSFGLSASNTLIIGDGIFGNEPDTIYLGDIKINSDGINNIGLVIIDGGVDEVMNIDKTNLIDIVDGGIDAVRNLGGDSKQRPIIDGNDYDPSGL